MFYRASSGSRSPTHNHSHSHTHNIQAEVTEVRASTDESVRLLREMVERFKNVWLALRGQPLPVTLTLQTKLEDMEEELRVTRLGRDNHAAAHNRASIENHRLRSDIANLRRSEESLYKALRKAEDELDDIHDRMMPLDFTFRLPEEPVSLSFNTLTINPKPIKIAVRSEVYRGFRDEALVKAFVRRVGTQLAEFIGKELAAKGRERVFGLHFAN